MCKRISVPATLICICVGVATLASSSLQAEITKYVRFRSGDTVAFGIVEGQRVRQIDGDLFGNWQKTDNTFALKEVELLVPTRPTQVFAMAGNYRSHLTEGETTTTITTTTKFSFDPKTKSTRSETTTSEEVRTPGVVPAKFQTPQPFFKSPSSLTAHETNIVLPRGATTVHYEAEMVIVIGRTAKDVPRDAALDYVFGVTCGNDVSERAWQKGDVQWWRAKASDSFGPCGPVIASGLDYDNLMLRLRLNGDVVQQENTSQLIHGVAATVSFISQHVTLHPGDLIFSGTPGETSVIKPGDVVEVELEEVGLLRNRVVEKE